MSSLTEYMRSWLEHTYGPDHWWACDFPERPNDRLHTHYHERCRPCFIAFEVAVHNKADWFMQSSRGEWLPVDEVVEHLRALLPDAR